MKVACNVYLFRIILEFLFVLCSVLSCRMHNVHVILDLQIHDRSLAKDVSAGCMHNHLIDVVEH